VDDILIGKGERPVHLLPRYGNRHGLVAGAEQDALGRPTGRLYRNDRWIATQHVKEGDFSYRIPVKGNDQLAELAVSFNTMTERLGKHDQQRRNLMADVAHELRTPITTR